MASCKFYRALLVDSLFGDISEEQQDQLQKHLHRCRRCSDELAGLQHTLELMYRKERPQQTKEFWDGYWERLRARMVREGEETQRATVPPGAVRTKRPGWRFAYTLAGISAVLLLGIALGKYVFLSHPSDSFDLRSPDIEVRQIDSRTAHYFETSKILLLGLLNSETPGSSQGELNYAVHKKASENLLQEAAFLKDNLITGEQRRLKQLIEELEVILLEIANLEEEEDLPGIEMLKSTIDRKGVLMKINIREMNRNISSDETLSGPVTLQKRNL